MILLDLLFVGLVMALDECSVKFCMVIPGVFVEGEYKIL